MSCCATPSVALYVAKEQHPGAVRYQAADDFYDPANLVLIAELRPAIDAGELVLHYQPKARFENGSFDSVEALVRWNHPVRGLLNPDVFLPLIEPTDLIDPLTDWVLTRGAHRHPRSAQPAPDRRRGERVRATSAATTSPTVSCGRSRRSGLRRSG